MSDSDDDIFAGDAPHRHPEAGGADGDDAADRGSRRRRSRRDAAPRYKDDSSADEDTEDADAEDAEEADVVVRAAPRRNRTPAAVRKAVKKEAMTRDAADADGEVAAADDGKVAADDAHSSAAAKSHTPPPHDDGIDVVIPHVLLNKHQGTGQHDCTLLVQVEANEEQSHHLDFHGQSGAIGRFEADDEGVILDLKGYQYRGTIRPGPTAMVVALTRDGQFKVEAITDEFVSLDASTKTDVMAKLDAVVRGDMDASYQYREENVNAHKKKGRGGDGDRGEGGDGGGGGGGAPKRRKTGAKK